MAKVRLLPDQETLMSDLASPLTDAFGYGVENMSLTELLPELTYYNDNEKMGGGVRALVNNAFKYIFAASIKSLNIGGSWTSPLLVNGWTDFGAPFSGAKYRKVMNTVHLIGVIKNGTLGLPAFVLPTGYRPLTPVAFAVESNSAFGSVLVDTNGEVKPSIGSTVYFYLNSISFVTDG